MTKVLDNGSVTLLDYYPKNNTELAIVNAARISFKQESENLSKRDIGLIQFLMRERHGTPFEMVDFKFHIKCPIFVAREWFRHRIASYNELSMRYKQVDPEFYIPNESAIRTQVGKPGAYTFERIKDSYKILVILDTFEKLYKEAESAYNILIDFGLAKELARAVLPVGTYTEFIFKVNLRSLLNFLSLRNDEHALYEIRMFAETIEEIIKPIVPNVIEYFNKYKRIPV